MPNDRVSFIVSGKRLSALSAGIYSPAPHALADTQCLDDFRLLYLLSGSGTYTDANGVDRTLIPGSVLFRIPGMKHTIKRDADNWCDFFVTLPGSFYASMASNGFIPSITADIAPSQRITHAVIAVIETMRHARAAAVLSRILDLFAVFEEHRTPVSAETAVLDEACAVLADDFTAEIDMPTLASRLHIGYEQFRKQFKQHTGHAPKEYRIRKKIAYAQHLLNTEAISVRALSMKLGYPTPFAFTRQFKKYTGLSPLIFKRAMWS